MFERHAAGTDVKSIGSALLFSSTQLLTVSSQMANPLTTAGRILDVAMDAYAITVVASPAGSFGAFFHGRSHERERDEAAGGRLTDRFGENHVPPAVEVVDGVALLAAHDEWRMWSSGAAGRARPLR